MTDWLPNNGVWVIVSVASALAVYLGFVHFLLRRLLSRGIRSLERYPWLAGLADQDESASNWVAALLGVAIALAAALASLAMVGIDIGPVTNRLKTFSLDAGEWLGVHATRSAVIILLAFVVHRSMARLLPSVVRAAMVRGKEGIELEEAAKRANALSQVGRYAVTSLVTVIAFIMVLSELGFNLAPIIAGVGIAGIALGFGAQNLVRDVISGMFILLEDQYRVGDVASVGGKTGLVEGVNLRVTILRDLDGIVHIVPNGGITVASNYTKSFSRVNLDVTVAYKEDLNHIFRVINRVGSELARDDYYGPLIIEPPQVLRVNSFDESGIGIKILGVTRPIRQWEVMGELRRRIKEEFDKEGIEIPFPHRTIYWGVESHPRLEPGEYTRGLKRTDIERTSALALQARDPWVEVSGDEAQAESVDGAGGRAVPNLMAHLDDVREILASPSVGLFSDIDGTLARIAPNPRLARVTPAVRQALGDVSRHMTVAVLTGRDVASARNILGLTSVSYHGIHGVESWERGNTTVLPEAQALKRQVQRLSKAVSSRLGSRAGVLVEDKGFSLAVHYRQAPDPTQAREAILNFLSSSPESLGLEIYEGKMVIETRVPEVSDKGMVLKRVVEDKGLASLLVFGDDLTDVDSFRMLRQLRREGAVRGIAIAVLGSVRLPELLSAADYYLTDAESVEIFLMWLSEQVRES